MKSRALNQYVNEIIDLAGENDVSWDVGVNLFLANVKNAGKDDAPYYPGADLDWEEVAQELLPLTPEDEAELIRTYCADYRAHMDEVIAARLLGDYREAAAMMTHAE